MQKNEKIKNEIKELLNQGKELIQSFYNNANERRIPMEFYSCYEVWYTKALSVVQSLQPNRKDDFIQAYKSEKRKEITIYGYVISDALKGIILHNSFDVTARLLHSQVKILETCLNKFESSIYDIQAVLQADLFDSEIESAKHLLKKGFVRAAGSICGVVLEKHLGKVCEMHGIVMSKKDPTLAVYNDALKDNVYDTLEWRRMQRLVDLRNLCDHNKNKEPTKEELEELIDGTDRVIKTIL